MEFLSEETGLTPHALLRYFCLFGVVLVLLGKLISYIVFIIALYFLVLEFIRGPTMNQLCDCCLVLSTVLVMHDMGQTYIFCLLQIVYPCFMSLMAFGSLQLFGVDECKQWLTYWVIFAIFIIVDKFSRFIPSYELMKLIYFVWL